MYYRLAIYDAAPHLAPYNGEPFSSYGYVWCRIYDQYNTQIESRDFRTMRAAHDYGAATCEMLSRWVSDSEYPSRYTVRYRPFSGMWCVQDNYALASNRRGTLAPYMPVNVKEYRTERAAHALARRLNTVDQSSAA